MRIKMLDTVEDSQPYIDDSGDKPQVKYSVVKLRKDAEYDGESMKGDPAWDKRAPKLVSLDFAVEVEG